MWLFGLPMAQTHQRHEMAGVNRKITRGVYSRNEPLRRSGSSELVQPQLSTRRLNPWQKVGACLDSGIPAGFVGADEGFDSDDARVTP